ncbi:hypothetical protein KC319_g18857 [Hortaea werneckii]|nr:hypothetical protein KC352_g38613 [Hortaea werneckii]KAI7619759.1 hypothetical protein KC319_g18857 [Hortaea werneckii]
MKSKRPADRQAARTKAAEAAWRGSRKWKSDRPSSSRTAKLQSLAVASKWSSGRYGAAIEDRVPHLPAEEAEM